MVTRILFSVESEDFFIFRRLSSVSIFITDLIINYIKIDTLLTEDFIS